MNGWRDAAADTEPLLRASAAASQRQQQQQPKEVLLHDLEQGNGNGSAGHSDGGSQTASAYSAMETSRSLLRTAGVVVVCLAWTCVSSIAILVNKHVMVDIGFKFPTTVAFMGLLTTTILSYITLQLTPATRVQRTPITLRYYLNNVLPTGFMMALTFQTGNGAYLHLSVAFVQMLKSCCPVITMLLLFATRLERATPKLVASIMLISFGVCMASYGEMNMSFEGLALMLTSVVAESMRLVMTQHLLVRQTLHPLEGLLYISSACTMCLMVLAAFFEWQRLLESSAFLLMLEHPVRFAASALAGFGVNALAILVITLSSSLTLKVLGTVKDAALVTIGVVFLQEVVSALQLSGYVLSLVGFVCYNLIKAQGKVQLPNLGLKAK